MRLATVLLAATAVVLSPVTSVAQSSQVTPSVQMPRLVNISGVFRPADGQPPAAVEAVTLSIYAEPEGGTPLWQETQSVALDAEGRYTLLLGATTPRAFHPRCLRPARRSGWGSCSRGSGKSKGRGCGITSVPYALRSADADTLGGRPASAYLLAPTKDDSGEPDVGAGGSSTDPVPVGRLPGTTNFLAKYVNGADVGNSAVYEIGGAVGIGTTSPSDTMHVRFTNTNGAFTGYAVQNLGNTATSYSGMLFYDQNGALGQFQGFNNVTHEYRINNVADESATAPSISCSAASRASS